MSARPLMLLSLACLFGCGNKGEKWVEAKQKAEDQAKAERRAEEEAPAQPTAKAESAPKDPYWDDPSLIVVGPEGKCPDGIWALFPGKAPGEDKAEQKRNEAERKQLAKKLKDARFETVIRPPNDLKLGEYDAPKGQFTLTAVGLVDCTDSAGHVSVAFNEAKAITPGASAAKQGAEITMSIWDAPAFHLPLPMKSMNDAKDFKNKHQFDLEGRIVFRLGKAEVNHKMFRTSKQSAAGISLGGGNEDWGAGRMVRAIVEGIRVTSDRGRTTLIDTRKK